MKFEVTDPEFGTTEQFDLTFEYGYYDKGPKKGHPKSVMAVVSILNPVTGIWEIESTGESVCHTNDHFVKETGRRMAIERLSYEPWFIAKVFIAYYSRFDK